MIIMASAGNRQARLPCNYMSGTDFLGACALKFPENRQDCEQSTKTDHKVEYGSTPKQCIDLSRYIRITDDTL